MKIDFIKADGSRQDDVDSDSLFSGTQNFAYDQQSGSIGSEDSRIAGGGGLTQAPSLSSDLDGGSRGLRGPGVMVRPSPTAQGQEPPVMPEAPDTLIGQLDDLENGVRRAVLFTNPDDVPSGLPSGSQVVDLDSGAGRVVYDPNRATAAEIKFADINGTMGDILGDADLGYGMREKPDPQNSIGALVLRDPTGTERQSIEVDAEGFADAHEALQKMSDPGDIIDLVDPQQILDERNSKFVEGAMDINRRGMMGRGALHQVGRPSSAPEGRPQREARLQRKVRNLSDLRGQVDRLEAILGSGKKWSTQNELEFKKAADVLPTPKAAVDSFRLFRIAQKMEEGKPLSEEEQLEYDAFALRQKIISENGITTMAQGWSIGLGMPKFMLEMLATGPVAGAVRGAIVKGTAKALKKQGARKALKSRAVKTALGVGATAAGTAARLPMLPHNISQFYAERMTDNHVPLTQEDGDILAYLIQHDGEEAGFEALWKATGEQYFELLGEMTGGGASAVAKEAGKVGHRMAMALKKGLKSSDPAEKAKSQMVLKMALINGYIKKRGKDVAASWGKLRNTLKKFGINALWTEILVEEGATEAMKQAAGLDPTTEDEPIVERTARGFVMEPEEYLAMAIGFAPLLGAQAAASAGISRSTQKKFEKAMKEANEERRLEALEAALNEALGKTPDTQAEIELEAAVPSDVEARRQVLEQVPAEEVSKMSPEEVVEAAVNPEVMEAKAQSVYKSSLEKAESQADPDKKRWVESLRIGAQSFARSQLRILPGLCVQAVIKVVKSGLQKWSTLMGVFPTLEGRMVTRSISF